MLIMSLIIVTIGTIIGTIIGITIEMIANDDNTFKVEKTTAKTFTRERHNMNVIVAEKPMFVMSIQRHKY